MEEVKALLEEYRVAFVGGEAALYVSSENAVVVSDIHLGFESAMADLGVFPPRRQLRRALESLSRIRATTGASKLIVGGDLKHVFEKLTRQEREEVTRFVERAYELGFKEVLVVRGNHDNYVSGLLKKLGAIWIEGYLELEKSVVITHGHEVHEVNADLVIIGHEHPALEISVGGFRERLPVFLVAPRASSGYFIVLPAMGEYQSGNVVTLDKTRYLSPWVREEALIEEAVPIIADRDLGTIALPKLGFLLGERVQA
ncbi:MAG: metallophosphoesterase [Acidilobaceae archaeon]